MPYFKSIIFYQYSPIKLSYFLKKIQNFRVLGAPPQTPSSLWRLGTPPPDPQTQPPQMRISGYAPPHFALFVII